MEKRAALSKLLKNQIKRDDEFAFANTYQLKYDTFFNGLRVFLWATKDGRVSVHLMRTPAPDVKTTILFKATSRDQWRELCANLKDIVDCRAENKYIRLGFGEKAKLKIDSIPKTDNTGFLTIITVCRYGTGEFQHDKTYSTAQKLQSSTQLAIAGGGKENWHHDQQSIVLEDDHITALLKDANLNIL